MRIAAVAVLALISGCQETATDLPAASPAARIGSWGIDLTAIDASVRPGDAFFRYANGAWLDRYEIPPDKTRYGTFTALRDQAEAQVREIVESLSSAGSGPSIEQKIGDYYRSFLDTATVEARGLDVLKGEIAAIRAIRTRQDLTRAFGRSDLDRSNAPIAIYLSIDRKNPDRWILSIGHAGLGLPERDFYLEDTERFRDIRSAYRTHIAQMLTFVDHGDAGSAAANILDLETEIAKQHWARQKRRDRDLTYNLYTLEDLAQEMPNFDWHAFFEAGGAVPAELIVLHPSAINPIVDVIAATPIATWKDYLIYHLLANNAFMLPSTIDDANFRFYGTTLYGQPEQRARWKRGISLVGGMQGLGEAIGRVYVQRHFSPDSKVMMIEMVENLRTAFRQRMAALEWMGDATKTEAYAKLNSFRAKIGYPDKWRAFTTLEIVADDLAGNVKRLRRYWLDDAIDRLGKPTDRDEWAWTAQTVNAGYLPQFNEIIFPAAILQPPFFDPNADDAVNYGAIGAVIGHEMGHGFDDQGSKSDASGVQRNWWREDDRARFETRADVLVRQYDAYEPIPGTYIDGRFTLGENIGDLGGLNIALAAYRLHLGTREAPALDGFSSEQRFFLSFAQVWRGKTREQRQLALLKSDTHSPSRYRTYTVRNVDAWYDAFDVGPEHALYLAPDQRVSIW
ncbi:MAG: M13 family peptidase [Proteobacteria bacterium]|nr:M13 family peptidase [Pseudomonadota bacterium]